MSCPACADRWRRRVRQTISTGIDRHPGPYQFVTLTFAGGNANVETALRAWKRFRKNYLWRYYDQPRYFRVLEPHKSGGVHIHLVLEKCLPVVPNPLRSESKASFLRRISPPARDLVRSLESYGFGWVTSVLDAYSGGNGCAAYMAKYLSKLHGKSLERANGRRCRSAEGSRNWDGAYRSEPEWILGTSVIRADTDTSVTPDCCDAGGSATESTTLRDKRITQWCQTIPSLSVLEMRYRYSKSVQRAYSRLQSECERTEPRGWRINVLRRKLDHAKRQRRLVSAVTRSEYGGKAPYGFLDYVASDLFHPDGPSIDWKRKGLRFITQPLTWLHQMLGTSTYDADPPLEGTVRAPTGRALPARGTAQPSPLPPPSTPHPAFVDPFYGRTWRSPYVRRSTPVSPPHRTGMTHVVVDQWNRLAQS